MPTACDPLILLGVIPIGSRPGAGQLFLSFLPTLLGALLIALLVIALANRNPRPRFLGRVPWPLRLLLGAAILVGALLYILPARPSGTTLQPRASLTLAGGPEDWPTFMGNLRRTGRAPGSAAPASGKKFWTFRDGLARAGFAASPAVSGNRIFAGSDNRQLYCLDAHSGQVLWKFQAACSLFASPAIDRNLVFLGEGLHHDNAAKLYCLDANSGTKLWEFATKGHIEASPTVTQGAVYFGAGEDGVYCLDTSGRQIWHHPNVHVDMTPALTDQGLFFGTFYGENAFYALDASTGQLLWKTPAPYNVGSSPSTDGKRLYFGLGNGTFGTSHAQPVGSVCCLEAATGRILWSTAVKDAVLTAIALDGDSLFFGSRDGHLYCADASTGKIRWSFDAQDPVLSSPAVADARVYFGSNGGQMFCLDARSGQALWSFDASQAAFNTDARIFSSPALAHGRLYFGCMNFLFFCLGE